MSDQAFINGFLKRAADYGVIEAEAIELLKQAERPYRQEQAAHVRALDELISANKYNRENHPGHYYLNPFVGGPITEGVNRLSRRMHAFNHSHPVVSEGIMGGGSMLSSILGNKEKKQKARKDKPKGYEAVHKQVSEE
jgi:hypothetical protein